MGFILGVGTPTSAAIGKQTAYTTVSTTPVLSGLGVVEAPSQGSTAYVSVCAILDNATLADGAEMDLYYALGTTIPAAGSATTGYTAYGSGISVTSTAAAQQNVVTLQAVISGLTLGASYVFTPSLGSVTGGTASMTILSMTVKDAI